MAEERNLPSNVNQFLTNIDNLMFVKLFRCFQMAISPNKMIVAFLAVSILAIGGIVMDLTTKSVALANYDGSKFKLDSEIYPSLPNAISELDVYIADSSKVDSFAKENYSKANQGVYLTMWAFCTHRFNSGAVNMATFNFTGVLKDIIYCLRAFSWAFTYHTAYSVVYTIFSALVLAFFGGAITRAAALEFAQNEKPGPAEILRFSRKRLNSFFYAPVAPFLLCLCFGAIIALLGFIANFPWVGEIILGILLLIAFGFGLLITLVLVGAIGGVGMMMPVISYEGTDGYDALGRAYCYSYSKPWKLAFYGVIALLYGSICYMFVRLVAFVLLKSTYLFLQMGLFVKSAKSEAVDKLNAIWPEPEFFNLLGSEISTNIQWSERLSSLLIYLAVLLIVGLISAFVVSFYFCANTVIYSLMRKTVDGEDFDEVYTEIRDLEKEWSDDIATNGETPSDTETDEEKPADSDISQNEAQV